MKRDSNVSKEVAQADRDCLAATAMAFAYATDVPRERALHRFSLSSLVRKFGSTAFSKSDAINIIQSHSGLPEIRPKFARKVFYSILDSGNVVRVSKDKKSPESFMVSDTFIRRCEDDTARIESTIEKVVSVLFAGSFSTVNEKKELTQSLLITISNVMERYGRQYAYQVAGKAVDTSVVSRSELVRICRTSTKSSTIHAEHMADAIATIFDSSESFFSEFAYSLTESYFYLRLLGIDENLSLFSSGNFQGTQFYLDTKAFDRN